MPDLKSFKQSFKKNALKLFFLFALIGLIGGSFLSLSFMGQHEKIFQMGQFTFKELDVQKSAQIYQALNPDIKDKSNEKIQSATIEWMMNNRVFSNFAQKNGFKASERRIQNAIKNTPYFQNEDTFSQKRYNEFIEFNNMDEAFLKTTLQKNSNAQILKSSVSKELFSSLKTPIKLLKDINQQSEVELVSVELNKIPDYSFKKAAINEYDFLKNHQFDIEGKSNKASKTISGKELIKQDEDLSINDLYTDKVKLKNTDVSAFLSDSDFESLNKKFQRYKKEYFIRDYIEQFFKDNTDLKKLAQSHQHFIYNKIEITPERILMTPETTNAIHDMPIQETKFFLHNNNLIFVKKLSTSTLLNTKESDNLRERFSIGFHKTFQQILQKEALKHYQK